MKAPDEMSEAEHLFWEAEYEKEQAADDFSENEERWVKAFRDSTNDTV